LLMRDPDGYLIEVGQYTQMVLDRVFIVGHDQVQIMSIPVHSWRLIRRLTRGIYDLSTAMISIRRWDWGGRDTATV
jgi:hypothetical protein